MNPIEILDKIATGPFVGRLISQLTRHGAVTYGPTDRRRIALTFDEGPRPKWTPRVLEILKRHNAYATFFVVGSNAEKYPTLTRNLIDQGHEIALHSYRHDRDLMRNIDDFRIDLQQAVSVVSSITGKIPLYSRYPYGSVGSRTDHVFGTFNLTRVYWSFSACDSYLPTEQPIVRRVTHLIRPGSIVLLHDCLADAATTPPPYRPDRTQLLKALDQLLPLLNAEALKTVTLSTLFSD